MKFARGITPLILLALTAWYLGCGETDKEPPITEKDFISVIVANHYTVAPTVCEPQGDKYRWVFAATNNSGYSWKGTLTLKLVNAESIFLDTHDFAIDEMIAPGECKKDLEFVSDYAIHDIGGEVTKVLVEANVTDYIEPEEDE